MSSTVDYKLLNGEEYIRELREYYLAFSKSIETTAKVAKKGKGKKQQKKKKIAEGLSVAGEAHFSTNTKNNSLVMSIVNKITNQTYSETIYIPYLFNVDQLIQKINRQYQNIQDDLIEDLELETVEVSAHKIEDLKNYKHILQMLQMLKASILERDLVEKNILIEKEAVAIKRDRELYKMIDFNGATDISIQSYLFNHQSIMNVVDKTNHPVILPGTKAIYNGEEVVITNTTIEAGQYEIVKSDGSKVVVPKGSLKIVEGIRNMIRNLKQLPLQVSLGQIVQKLAKPDAVELLLDVLGIDSTQDDLVNRPRKEVKKETGVEILKHIRNKQVFDDIADFHSYVDINLLMNSDNSIIIGSRTSDKCLLGLKLSDRSHPFKVDDFTFQSVQTYHKACYFYNRQDLPLELRKEYNDFFIKFTGEYNGTDSTYDFTLSEINTILMNSTFTRPYDWNVSAENDPSLNSKYLRKGLYHKIKQHASLKKCLLDTGLAVLYEKIGKNRYRINYELMEVRYFLQNGVVPPYSDFNYSSEVLLDFNNHALKKQDSENRVLVEVFVELDSYSNRTVHLDKVNPIEDIAGLYAQKEPIKPMDTDKVYKILYSYLGQYMYETVRSNRELGFERLLKLNPEFNTDLDLFSFIYVFFKLEEKLKAKQHIRNEANEKALQQANQEKQEQYYKSLKYIVESRVRLMKYIPNPWIEGRTDSLYYSIINNLAIQNKYPMNHANELDTRERLPRDKSEASLALLNGIVNLYRLWKPADLETPNAILDRNPDMVPLEIRLISRYLGADITVINNKEIVEVKYLEQREAIAHILPEMVDYTAPHAHIVLATIEIDHIVQVTDTKPDPSKKEAIVEYLLDKTSGVLLKELDEGSQAFIGIWDPIEMIIDYDSEMPSLDDAELEMDIIQFYRIDDRLYYQLTEIV